MDLRRRRFLELVGGALAVGLGAPSRATAQERALAVHHATRNTLLGAVGVGLRRELQQLGDPPRRAKAWPGRPRLSLPEPDREPVLPVFGALDRAAAPPSFRTRTLSRAQLARLLHFTWGVTGRSPAGIALRAAPSAGALYAGEMYVVAERIEGLEPGVYAFAPLEGKLVALRRGSALDTVLAALEAPTPARGAALSVLLTNVFARYERRYAHRGYRYALIDSGHQGENLRLTAASAGLASHGPLRFRDAPLNALLGTDGIEEAVCAVHLVGAAGVGAADEQARPDARRTLVEAHRAGRPLPEAADDPTERYHAATALVEAEGGAPVAGGGDPAATSPTAETRRARGDARELPEREPPTLALETAIERRRSARRFRAEPLAAADLRAALSAAVGHAGLRRAAHVGLRLFVHRVEGLPSGLYDVRPSASGLRALRQGDLAADLVDACLRQQKAGQAAVACAMVGDLQRAAAEAGDRAYRDLLLEAGGIGQRLYLAAEALGIAARNLAAFVDESLNELAGLDGRRRAVIHLTLLGPGD